MAALNDFNKLLHSSMCTQLRKTGETTLNVIIYFIYRKFSIRRQFPFDGFLVLSSFITSLVIAPRKKKLCQCNQNHLFLELKTITQETK